MPRIERSAPAILDALTDLWFRPGLVQAARDEAVRLRAQYDESALDGYRRLLPPLLDGA